MLIFVLGILTPTDEFQYWSDSKGARGNRERNEYFVELFSPISAEFAGLDSMSILEVK